MNGARDWSALAVMLLFAASACAGGDGTAAGSTTFSATSGSIVSGSTSTDVTSTSVSEPSTSTVVTTTSTPFDSTMVPPETTMTTESTVTTVVTTTLPGVPFDGFASDGAVLNVMGVAWDDSLNIRVAPGTDQMILATVAPTSPGFGPSADLTATGRAQMLSRSIWYEVDVLDVVGGWASAAFLGFVGPTDDVTAQFLAENPGLAAEKLADLGDLVALIWTSAEPESRVVQSAEASFGDLGEVMFDVIGVGDDSVAGYRIHVFANVPGSDQAFEVRNVEVTVLCSRGVLDDLCV